MLYRSSSDERRNGKTRVASENMERQRKGKELAKRPFIPAVKEVVLVAGSIKIFLYLSCDLSTCRLPTQWTFLAGRYPPMQVCKFINKLI